MDGTMAGYYLAEGSNKDLFIIFLEGGGACYDKTGCDKRAKGPLGSSKQLAPTFDGGTHLLVNPDCSKNPSFCAATRVVVAYCTGDTHVGNNTSPSAASWGYYFDGHANLVHIVEQLVAGHGLGKAGQKVMLAGRSAGGVGTFHNVDWLQQRLGAGVTVKGVPNAGWFTPAALPDDLPAPSAPSDWANFSAGTHGNAQSDPALQTFISDTLWKSRGLLPPDCVAAQPADAWFACASVHVAYRYLKAPLFIVESQFDSNQIQNQEGAPRSASSPAEQAALELYIARYGAAMRNSTQQVLTDAPVARKAQKDGLFHPSCFQHGVWNLTTVQGQVWLPIVHDWFYELGELQQYYRMVERCPAGSSSAGGFELPCGTSDPTQGLPCRVPGLSPTPSPGPGPGPSPEAKCKAQLVADGCLKAVLPEVPASVGPGLAALNACEKCALQHETDLESACAGLTKQQAIQLCAGNSN